MLWVWALVLLTACDADELPGAGSGVADVQAGATAARAISVRDAGAEAIGGLPGSWIGTWDGYRVTPAYGLVTVRLDIGADGWVQVAATAKGVVRTERLRIDRVEGGQAVVQRGGARHRVEAGILDGRLRIGLPGIGELWLERAP